MACPKANVKFQLRRATAAEWASTSRILLDGEPGYDTTNNILKIGRNNLPWSGLTALNNAGGGASADILYQAPTITTISTNSTNLPEFITVTWTYPSQQQTAVFQEPLPLIIALNVELVHGGGTIPILTNMSTSPFVYKSSSPTTNPINTIKFIPIAGTSGVSSSQNTVYDYYNNQLRSLTQPLTVRVWYTNYSQSSPTKSSIVISRFTILPGPPSVVRNVSRTLPTDSSSALTISFDPPLYANDIYRSDSSATIANYYITITNPSRSSQNRTRFVLGNARTYTEPIAYANTTYSYTIYAINSYGLESSVSGSVGIPLPDIYSSTLAITQNTNAYFANVYKYINNGSGRSKTVLSGPSNLIRTFNTLTVSGNFAAGNFDITWPSGTIATNAITYSNGFAGGSRNIVSASNSQTIGTINSQGVADYWISRPDRVGTNGYYVLNNTITVNLNTISSLANIDSSQEQAITFQTPRGSASFNFHVSNINGSSSAPTILSKTLNYAPAFNIINGFKVCNTTQFTVEASANVSTLGKYFFPTDWIARFNVLGSVYSYDISNFYTRNNDTTWFITVPSPSTSSDPSVINPAVGVGPITRIIYYGTLSGSVDMKNLNNSTLNQPLTINNTNGTDPMNNGYIFIDNNSYYFSQSNRISLQLPVAPPSTSAGNLNTYNNNASIVSSSDIMIYDGRYTSAGALPGEVLATTSLSNTSRYATFGFVIPGNTNASGRKLGITIGGLESPNYFSGNSYEITSNGTQFNIFYRFETQYSTGGDYRIPRNEYTLPNASLSRNYTTGWISANSSSSQDISTTNYNSTSQSSIFNGLDTSSFSGSSASFLAFQPQIQLNANSPPLYLYITVGGASSSRLRFTTCSYGFI